MPATTFDGRLMQTRAQNRQSCVTYYERNRARFAARNKKQLAELRTLIASLKNVPCLDCGRRYPPWVMDFDHVRGVKLFDVALGPRRGSRSAIMAEVEKCDVVCSNCHRERTHRRKNPMVGVAQR